MDDRNRGFRVGPRLAKLTGAYPPAEDVLSAAAVGAREKAVLARLWISEGIPYAFRKCPGLYEEVRNWLAVGLALDAKQVSVVGSGRLGYSLAPKRWGEPYKPEKSDLDFFAVSEELFEGLCKDFERWRSDYVRGAVQPESDLERRHWESNREDTPINIGKGFIDSWRVPNRSAYRGFLNTNRRLDGLRARVQEAAVGPKLLKTLTLRCYKDWPAFERQLVVNLKAVAVEAERNKKRG